MVEMDDSANIASSLSSDLIQGRKKKKKPEVSRLSVRFASPHPRLLCCTGPVIRSPSHPRLPLLVEKRKNKTSNN
jgi:hypothetical protein